eukprot:scaffold86633_cov27-Phaeocystis_antarctica.AAC.1
MGFWEALVVLRCACLPAAVVAWWPTRDACAWRPWRPCQPFPYPRSPAGFRSAWVCSGGWQRGRLACLPRHHLSGCGRRPEDLLSPPLEKATCQAAYGKHKV